MPAFRLVSALSRSWRAVASRGTAQRVLLIVAVALVWLIGCAKANVTVLPSGDTRIVCERGMKLCVSRADKLCGDDGYVVISGATKKKLLGGSSSSYREMSEVGELVVRCGSEGALPEQEEVPYVALPPRTDEPVRAQTCVPGATQVCVGAGACQGGQVCSVDGSGFGACDCGSAPAAAPRPAPPAPAPAPAKPVAPAPSGTAPQPVPGSMPAADPL